MANISSLCINTSNFWAYFKETSTYFSVFWNIWFLKKFHLKTISVICSNKQREQVDYFTVSYAPQSISLVQLLI